MDSDLLQDSRTRVIELFHQVAASVPAYRAFLREHGVDPGEIRTFADFERLPLLTKENYHRRYPLPDLCRQGRLDGCDMIAVSSGSTGQPTIWPRSVTDEVAVAARFEQVFADSFAAGERTTLARSEEHTSELQSHVNLVCRLLLEKKKKKILSPIVLKKKKKK